MPISLERTSRRHLRGERLASPDEMGMGCYIKKTRRDSGKTARRTADVAAVPGERGAVLRVLVHIAVCAVPIRVAEVADCKDFKLAVLASSGGGLDGEDVRGTGTVAAGNLVVDGRAGLDAAQRGISKESEKKVEAVTHLGMATLWKNWLHCVASIIEQGGVRS